MNQFYKLAFDISQAGVVIGGDQIYVYTDTREAALERGEALISGLVGQQAPGLSVAVTSIMELPKNTVVIVGMGGQCLVPTEEAPLVTLVDHGSKVLN